MVKQEQPHVQAPRPFVIALTGGPCAGKTTLLEELKRRETLAQHQLLFVPEAATILMNRGLSSVRDVRAFQTEVMRLQLQLEGEALAQAATRNNPCAIICDRGTLDGAGYCPADMFASIAASFGETPASLGRRYNLVLHLISAAVEAPEAYTTANNAVRREKNLEAAIEQERLTLAAWAAHPARAIVGSTTGFQPKIHTAIQTMEQALAGR